MSTHLIDALATTEPLSTVFSDHALIAAMIDVEAALARVLGRRGVIPADAAEAIDRIAHDAQFDAAQLARDARSSGTVVIPLVAALTERVRGTNADAAKFVHWGATSQDIADTAFVLLLTRAKALLAADQQRLKDALRALSDAHATTVMLGRTLLQPAPPITFGLKAAGWFAASVRT